MFHTDSSAQAAARAAPRLCESDGFYNRPNAIDDPEMRRPGATGEARRRQRASGNLGARSGFGSVVYSSLARLASAQTRELHVEGHHPYI